MTATDDVSCWLELRCSVDVARNATRGDEVAFSKKSLFTLRPPRGAPSGWPHVDFKGISHLLGRTEGPETGLPLLSTAARAHAARRAHPPHSRRAHAAHVEARTRPRASSSRAQ